MFTSRSVASVANKVVVGGVLLLACTLTGCAAQVSDMSAKDLTDKVETQLQKTAPDVTVSCESGIEVKEAATAECFAVSKKDSTGGKYPVSVRVLSVKDGKPELGLTVADAPVA